jgi:hypothetical protein
VYLATNIVLGDKNGEATYTYDHYRVEVFQRPGIDRAVEEHFDEWLAIASEKEAAAGSPQSLDERLATVEAENTALKLRLAKVEAVPSVKTELSRIISDPTIKDPILTR